METLQTELYGRTTVRPYMPDVPKHIRERLGDFLYQMVDYAISAREELEANLDYYYALDEMMVEDRDWPWEDASNFVVPFIPAQILTLAGRLTGAIFVERFFLVAGHTPEAAAHQFEVERYYNAELSRHHWVRAFYDCLLLALRDGTSIMEIMWKHEVQKRKFVMSVPRQDEFGNPELDDDGNPATDDEVKEIELETYNDVELTPVELRDFLLLPSWQTSIEAAGGVARMKMFTEYELRSMVKSKDNPEGWLWEEQVEQIVSRRNQGESDLNMSQQSTLDYTISAGSMAGQIDITEDVSNYIPELGRTSGPFKCWLIILNVLDMNGDGESEENVFLLHEESQICAGAMAYPYMHGHRCYVSLAPIPRAKRFYGKALSELLRTVQEELNNIHNQINDQGDLRLSPPRYIRRGVMVHDQDKRWGPDAEYEVDAKDDVGLIPIQDLPESAYMREEKVAQYGYMIAANDVSIPDSMAASRKTKAEVQQRGMGSNVRIDMMASIVRDFAKEVLWQIHHLKLQYGPEELQTTQTVQGQPQVLIIPKNMLSLDYEFGIAGEGGPADKQARMQETMLMYSLLMQNPLVAGNPMHIYALTRHVLEVIGVSDIQTFIGTPDDIQKMIQGQQEQQQFQQKLQMTLAQHGLSMPQPQGSQTHRAQRKSGGHSGAQPMMAG